MKFSGTRNNYGWVMNKELFDKSIIRLLERLEKLESAGFVNSALLVHRLSRGPHMDMPAKVDRCGRFLTSGSGLLRGIEVDTPFTAVGANNVKVGASSAKFPAAAGNTVFLDACPCAREPRDFQRQQDELMRVAADAGRLLSNSVKALKSEENLWSMWSSFDPNAGEGLWFDFVFELAWKNLGFILLEAERKCDWDGNHFTIDSSRSPDFFNNSWPPLKSNPIPDPVTVWYSELDDIVAASRVALEFFQAFLSQDGNSDNEKLVETITVDEHLKKIKRHGRKEHILTAMFEKNMVDPLRRRSQQEIIELAIPGGEAQNHRRVFKDLKESGLISMADAGGFFLTPAGVEVARMFKENN